MDSSWRDMFVSLPTDYSHCALKVVRLGTILNTFILWLWSVYFTWKQHGVIFQRSRPLLNYQEHTNKSKIIQSPDAELCVCFRIYHSKSGIIFTLFYGSLVLSVFTWCLIDIPLTSLATLHMRSLSNDATSSTGVPIDSKMDYIVEFRRVRESTPQNLNDFTPKSLVQV